MDTNKSMPPHAQELSKENYERMVLAMNDATGDAPPMLVLNATVNLLTCSISERYGDDTAHAFFARVEEFTKKFPLLVGRDVATDQEQIQDKVVELAKAINAKWANMEPRLTVIEAMDGAASIIANSWLYFYGSVGYDLWKHLMDDFFATLANDQKAAADAQEQGASYVN
jgi:predicted ATPase